MTPDDVRQQILQVVRDLKGAANAHYESELAVERAEADYQHAVDRGLLSAEGNVSERTAIARLGAVDARDAAIIARATHNRVRLKARHLEAELVGLQALLKSIQYEGA